MTTYNVTTGDNTGPGSLRQAIDDANNDVGPDPPIIAIDSSVTLIMIQSTSLLINRSMTIRYEDLLSRVTISKVFTSLRTFEVNAGITGLVKMERLEIVGGAGGAIINQNASTLEIENCLIRSTISSGSEGAIHNTGNSLLTMVNSIVRSNNNPNENGGGIYNSDQSVVHIYSSIIDNNSSENGGGIYNTDRSIVNIYDSNINTNRSNMGAGIYNDSGCLLYIENSTIDGNSTIRESPSTYGAGIYNLGQFNLINSEIGNNRSPDLSNSILYGCGIYTSSSDDCSITGCQIYGNYCSGTGYGAGVSNNGSGTLGINMSTIRNNVAEVTGNGGGIENTGSVRVENSSIYNNSNNNGGGIFHSGEKLDATNSTISTNASNQQGGGFYCDLPDNGTTTIINCTVSGNFGIFGVGGIFLNASNLSMFTMGNTIVAANTTTSETPDFLGDATSLCSYNLIGNNEGSNFADGVNNNIVGTSGAPEDPLLKPLGDYGGPTLTMTLQPGSRAFDNGNTGHIPPGVEFDQRGPGYPRILDSTVNIGATEGTSVCYSGESLVLVKNIDTNEISEIKAKDVFSNKHLAFDTVNKTFIPIKFNIVTGPIKRYMKIEKNSLGNNKPNADFYVTSGHKLVIDGKEIKASKVSVAKRIKVKPEKIYSICTENRTTVQVNNLDVMTWGYNEWLKTCIKRGVNWVDNN